MDRFLRDRRATHKYRLRNEDGTEFNADAATAVTAAVTDSAGVAIGGSPFAIANPPASTGGYELVLSPARTAQMDVYDVEWNFIISGAAEKHRSSYEVVGGFMFAVSDLRSEYEELTAAKASGEVVRAARLAAEQYLEERCKVAFFPRAHRSFLSGSGDRTLLLETFFPRRIYSGSIDDGSGAVALTAEDIADIEFHDWGALDRSSRGTWSAGDRNVVLFYEHWKTQEPPAKIQEAAMMLAHREILQSPMPSRAESVSTDSGTFRLSIQGADNSGIPEVEAAIALYGHDGPDIF